MCYILILFSLRKRTQKLVHQQRIKSEKEVRRKLNHLLKRLKQTGMDLLTKMLNMRWEKNAFKFYTYVKPLALWLLKLYFSTLMGSARVKFSPCFSIFLFSSFYQCYHIVNSSFSLSVKALFLPYCVVYVFVYLLFVYLAIRPAHLQSLSVLKSICYFSFIYVFSFLYSES